MNDRQHRFQTLDEIGEFFEKCPGLTFIFTARGSEGMSGSDDLCGPTFLATVELASGL